MSALMFGKIGNYWTSSETYEDLKRYISMNFDGLKDAVIEMLGGGRVSIYVSRFQNDMASFHTRDDILTLLIHLGYLGYDEKAKSVYIPNLEVSEVFRDAVVGEGWKEVQTALSSRSGRIATAVG